VDNYIGQRESFSVVSGPKVYAKGLTNAVDIFEEFFDKNIVERIVTETNRYAEQFKNVWDTIFSKWSTVSK
jgi:hypothetical protein